MQLLTTALVITLLFTTASFKPIGWPRHQDADIADNDLTQGLLDGTSRLSWRSTETSRYDDSSSESSSSESSESSESQSSEESSEEDLITDQTTQVVIDTAMTTIATEGTTFTTEPDTVSTDEPTVTTPPPVTPTTSVAATLPGCVTDCFTEEIPTAAPITEMRGDN
ncbi:secretory calcium-binding phosphoprotein 8 [Anoplopoma fimbria]|uniref:secretory calcium-binding phosphoprotein 8 n=1 Tax=Anoplopoma fimbria TaxID=229290 RepID=UPI0023EB3856|nr:secretory calcium-binding phosphoprotein 8 [Anoplopoma fimbria]